MSLRAINNCSETVLGWYRRYEQNRLQSSSQASFWLCVFLNSYVNNSSLSKCLLGVFVSRILTCRPICSDIHDDKLKMVPQVESAVKDRTWQLGLFALVWEKHDHRARNRSSRFCWSCQLSIQSTDRRHGFWTFISMSIGSFLFLAQRKVRRITQALRFQNGPSESRHKNDVPP